MTLVSTIITDFKRSVKEPTTDTATISHVELVGIIDKCQKKICSELPIIYREKSFALVANQFDYALPSEFVGLLGMSYQQRYDLEIKDEINFYDRGGGTSSSTRPEKIAVIGIANQSGKYRLEPIPSAASETTTANGSVASNSTSITVVSTADFLSYGKLIIESEEITYYAKSSTQFLQCVRGEAGTTAVIHASGTTITQADMIAQIYIISNDISASGSTLQTPPRFDDLYNTFLKSRYYKANMTKEKEYYNDFIAKLKDAKQAMAKTNIRKTYGREGMSIKPRNPYIARY